MLPSQRLEQRTFRTTYQQGVFGRISLHTFVTMKIFLCYAREQLEVAHRLASTLSSFGHEVFFDRSSLVPGKEFEERIQKEVDNSDIFVFLASAESLEDECYAQKELAMAAQKWPDPSGRVLPVTADPHLNDLLPEYLRRVTVLQEKISVEAEVANAVRLMGAKVQRHHSRARIKHATVFTCGGLLGLLALWRFGPEPSPMNAGDFLSRGNAFVDSGDLKSALRNYDLALEVSSSFPWAHLNRGVILSEMGQHSRGLDAVAKAIELEPSLKGAHYNQGLILERMGRYEEALKALDQAALLCPDDADILASRGGVLASMNQLDMAIASYNAGLKLLPEDAEIYYNKGCAYLKQKRFPDAEAQFQECLSRNPRHVKALHNLAASLMNREEWKKALKVLTTASYLFPDRADFLAYQAATLNSLDRHEEALAAVVRALELEPRSADIHDFHGIILNNLGRLDDALPAFEAAMAIDNMRDSAARHHLRALVDLGLFGEALEAFDRAHTRWPVDQTFSYERARALDGLGETVDAEAILSVAVEKNPGLKERALENSHFPGLLQSGISPNWLHANATKASTEPISEKVP